MPVYRLRRRRLVWRVNRIFQDHGSLQRKLSLRTSCKIIGCDGESTKPAWNEISKTQSSERNGGKKYRITYSLQLPVSLEPGTQPFSFRRRSTAYNRSLIIPGFRAGQSQIPRLKAAAGFYRNTAPPVVLLGGGRCVPDFLKFCSSTCSAVCFIRAGHYFFAPLCRLFAETVRLH